MTFLQPLSWTQFRNLLSSSTVHYSGHPTFLDFLENNLIDYIVHQKALPKATRIHHWYELVSMTKQIRVRMERNENKTMLLRLVFDACPSMAMRHGVRTAQLEFLDHQLVPLSLHGQPPDLAPENQFQSLPSLDSAGTFYCLLDPLALMEVLSHMTLELEDLDGYAELRVLPEQFQRRLSHREFYPLIAKIVRPYQEVVELLQMSHDVLKVIGPGQIVTWDHKVNPVVYITALGSTFTIPRFLFTIYLVVTDTQPLFLIKDLDHPPSYPITTYTTIE